MATQKTPLMKQYDEMKMKHPDAVLLFRVGDFYETFGEDAQISSDILGITLTRRANGKDNYIALAGFPHYALDTYLPKLIRAGKRVAICEQLEDPKLSKRTIPKATEVVTPACKVAMGSVSKTVKIDYKALSSILTLFRECVEKIYHWQEMVHQMQDIRTHARLLNIPLKKAIDEAVKEITTPPAQPSLFDYCSEPSAEYIAIPQIVLSYTSDSKSKIKVKCSQDASEHFRQSFKPGEIELREYFKVIYLNRANKILGIHTHSIGGSISTIVDLKLILSGALLANASSIIVCHNHPSGNLSPSSIDDNLTKRIKEGCKIVDLMLHDHIIISEDGYYSYKDEGRL